MHLSHQPLAVFMLAESDWNNAAYSPIFFKTMKEISKSYKVFICEAQSKQEAVRRIVQLGYLHGATEDGAPEIPIDLLTIEAHGGFYGMIFDTLTWKESQMFHSGEGTCDKFLSASDLHYFQMIQEVMRARGMLVAASCSTVLGGPEAENFLTALKAKCSDLEVWGARIATSFAGFDLHPNGLARRPLFNAPSDKVVRL